MKKLVFLFLAPAIFCAVPAKAQVLNFDGIAGCLVSVGNYYNGGTAGDGSGPGPNLGVVFSSSATTIQDFFAGGDAACLSNVGNMPSPPMGLFFLSGSGTMDVATGFTTGFSFFYSAQSASAFSISVWSGLDGTGTVLALLPLPTNDNSCITTPTFCNWDPIGVTFSGTAESVVFFGGIAIFDDITLNSSTPGTTPEPGTLVQMGSGLIGLVGALRRKLWKA